MSLLTEAEMFEKAEKLDDVIALYKQYTAVTECISPEMHYKIGMAMLAECKEHFDQDVYQIGIEHLIDAYNQNYDDKESIYQLLYDVVYLPNADVLKNNYEKSSRIYQKKHQEVLFPRYAELQFLVFPISDKYFRIYDLKINKFLANDECMLEVEVYISFIKDDIKNFENADCKIVLQNLYKNSQVQKKICEIEAAFEQEKCDEIVLQKIKEFGALSPYSEKCEWALGKFFYIMKSYKQAIPHLEKGLIIRPLNIELNLLAANTYFQQKCYEEAAVKFLFLSLNGEIKKWWDSHENYDFNDEFGQMFIESVKMVKQCTPERIQNLLNKLNIEIKDMREFIARKEFSLTENLELEENVVFLIGKIIEKAEPDLNYFAGLYAEYTRVGTCVNIASTLIRAGNPVAAYRTTYDVLDAKIVRNVLCKAETYPCLVPFMATEQAQQLDFIYKGERYSESFGGLECNFLRISEPLKINSRRDFAVGQPIVLEHSNKRKKIVLSILVDAGSFAKMQEDNFKLVPNMKKFFDKGIIFTENYTPSEWTLSAAASIQTGLYQDRTQIFHPDIFVQLPAQYDTIPQYMREKGYYCMLFEACLSPRLCNTYRGFHRAVGNESYSADRLVADALKHIRVLKDSDVFMHLHMLDAHIHGQPIALEQQVNLDMKDYFNLSLSDTKSVYSESSRYNLLHYEEKLKQVDAVLASLFHYIETAYNENDYVVVLYADHGISIVGDEKFMFKEGMANAPFMIRGANVPKRGLVDNEVTNTIDLYATLAHLCECEIRDDLDCCLPKVFGGKGREYSVSNSIYPGQTYKLSIYTLEYKFYLETIGCVSIDGKVNMHKFTYQLFKRDQEQKKIEDQALLLYFLKIACDHTKRIHDPNL